MKVRNINDEWVVLDGDAVVSRHASKRAALLTTGYRGRQIPTVKEEAPPFLAKAPVKKTGRKT